MPQIDIVQKLWNLCDDGINYSDYVTELVLLLFIKMEHENTQSGLLETHKLPEMARFNVGSMKITPLPLSPIDEQKEIVRRVKTLFAFADRLAPSILGKASRGELVPQDPADGPVAELLKRLAGKKVVAPFSKKRKARPAQVNFDEALNNAVS